MSLCQSRTTLPTYDEPDDYLDSLQNIPSNFDLAMNGDGTNPDFLSSEPKKTATDVFIAGSEASPRLSMSTISSMGRQRSVSPYPGAAGTSRTWKSLCWNLWTKNHALFFVTSSQFFGSAMNVAARLLESEGGGMHPLHILFARQGLTTIICTAWMWYAKVPGFPFGHKETRGLLVARSITGFFGIFGMY